MADVPILTLMPASNTSYGDEFILQYTAKYPIQICLTDNITTYYPFPAQTGIGGCTLFYNLNPATEEQVVIQFQNYMNNPALGNMQTTTRIYFTAWSDYVDNVSATMGAGFDVNFTIMPTSKISSNMTINWFWQARALGGNDEFVNFDIYIGNQSFYQTSQTTLVLGPSCDNSYCRSNISHELYDENLATYVSTTQILPSPTDNQAKVYDKGVQMVPLSTLGKNFTDVFVTI